MAKIKSSTRGKQQKKIVPVKPYTKKMVLGQAVTDGLHGINLEEGVIRIYFGADTLLFKLPVISMGLYICHYQREVYQMDYKRSYIFFEVHFEVHFL